MIRIRIRSYAMQALIWLASSQKNMLHMIGQVD